MFVEFSSDYCCDITKKSFFSFFVSFVVKLASFWPHGCIEHTILHPMVPLAFLWDAQFNHKTGNVREIFKWLLLWYNEKIFFFIFFFFCCQAGHIMTPWLNWAFNSAFNGALGISVRRFVQPQNRQCSWNFSMTTAVIYKKNPFFHFFFFFVVKLASFWPIGWIEHSILHPMVSLAFQSEASFNHKTGNVRGVFKLLLLWYNKKIFFFFLVKLVSFCPHGWIQLWILHPMVPLAFLWDASFNHKTGNVRGIFKWLLLWYNEKTFFFIFFFILLSSWPHSDPLVE